MNAYKQQGMSSLGLLVIIGIAAFLLTCAFRVLPLYWGDWSVKNSLDKLRDDDLNGLTIRDIRSKVGKSFTVDGINNVTAKDVKIERKRDRIVITLDYEERAVFLGNLDVVARFSHKIDSSDKKE